MENIKIEKNELVELVQSANNPQELKSFLHYFANEFFDDFHRYYKVTRDHQFMHNEIVLFCNGHFNECRKDFHFRDDTHKEHFVVALFYTALLPQAVGFVCGENVLLHFHRVTSTAWINCGMHGLASPILILKESDLFDQFQNPEEMRLLEDAMPVMRWWLETILTGEGVSCKNRSLGRSIEVVQREAGYKVDEIWEAACMHVEALKRHLADPQKEFPMKFFHDFS